MKHPFTAIRRFIQALGPVEQAQMVASTAVVVSMATIISALAVTGQSVRLMDFISILTVGTIGFTSVYFSLQYSRQLDEQRRQLLAMNTIAESVNRVVELDYVLQTALTKITDLLNIDFGWIYMVEGNRLVLKCSRGTTRDFLAVQRPEFSAPSHWITQPHVQRELLGDHSGLIDASFKDLGMQFWASIPLGAKDIHTGALIVAGRDYEMFTRKQAELMEAFGNQISVALNNAQLFDRLKQSERQYIDLFENAPDLYLTVNRDHKIVDCNVTGAVMLGSERRNIVGRPFEELFVEDKRDILRTRLEEMFTGGQALKDLEQQLLTRNQHALFVTLNSSFMYDERGSIVNARIVARDISERKKMEAAILHAQKIDSIGNLAGGIAHDFNNILAAILGSASIMRRRLTVKARLAKYVEIIESSARRGSSLTRQLLTFARKAETFAKPVDMNGLIMETLNLFERSVTKEIAIETSLSTEAVMVSGDDGQLQQALLNLFLNARDAMPDGGTLTVSTAATVADAHTMSLFASITPGPFVVVRVADTGHGIDRAIQNRVFEPFFTTKDHGTGLGLSVVYGVVQNHGGFINLESEVGHGTTFSVYLPRVFVKSPAVTRQRQRIPHGTENVLIIDDELSVCEIARDMLQELGYTVYVEHNGRDGVESYRIRRAVIDLILLDINMPVMGGKDAFELLRAMDPAVRIIIVTGYGKGTVETSKFSSEVNGFIQKPFQMETLALKVREVLDARIAHGLPHPD